MKIPANGFTHAGKFHADDVFATALLQILRPDIKITRGFTVPDDFDGIVYDVDKDKCHMLFVKDDDLKQAFITMMNKLVYAHRIILKPYVDALKNTSSDDSLRRIQEIQTLLAHNTEKRETLTKLMTQGIIDPILFNKETNELLSQADSFRDEINALKNAVSGDVTKIDEAAALLRFTGKGGILQEFDDDLFQEYVNRIIVRSRNEVCFELKCGLTLRERM